MSSMLLDCRSVEDAARHTQLILADLAVTTDLAAVHRAQPTLISATLNAALPDEPPQPVSPVPSPDWSELPVPERVDESVVEPSDDGDDSEPGHEVDEGAVLASIARETWVFAEPRWKSRRLGYLRAGAVIVRDPEVATHQSCKGGWYAVRPRGFVCVGTTATTDLDHPVVKLSQRRPNLRDAPYPYVMSRYPTPPLYARLPTIKQQSRVEPSRRYLMRKHQRRQRNPDYVAPPEPDPIPELIASRQLVPGLGGIKRGKKTVSLGRARVRSGFALLASYDHEGRRFGLTPELTLVPLDRTRVVRAGPSMGVHLSDEFTLPIAIVRSQHATRFEMHEQTKALAAAGKLPWRSALGLTGKIRRRGGRDYYQARDGSYVRADRVVKIDRFKHAPRWAKQGKKWVDVSILRQALVAYDGTRPVFATLVSTGADGLQDHEDSHATIQGTFLIHTKHVSVTMDGDERGDEFDLHDVPYVQYFQEGYALHGAYWHDDFGTPRSHGCVNLAPKDAAWLFGWTDPQVPTGWHAALSLKKGTTVYVHP